MSHPHAALLREYKFAIDHLVPTVPKALKEEALKMYEALLADESATEGHILDALIKTGKAEYPHRHAFHALTKSAADEKRTLMVLEHVEPSVKQKLGKLLASGASLEEVIRSRLFEEQLNPEERYQVQDGLLDADEHVKGDLAAMVEAEKDRYAALVKEKESQMQEIQLQIDRLKALADKDPKWKDEILDKVRLFEAGWAVTEKDPELETVKKEIEYWRGTLGEEV